VRDQINGVGKNALQETINSLENQPAVQKKTAADNEEQ
jgi:hypothetical protein